MKKLLVGVFSLLLLGVGCTQPTVNTGTIEPVTFTVYTYDSLADVDYGLLPKITNQFELDHQVSINLVSFPDSGAMVNQLIAERNAPVADVAMGIDNIDLARYSTEGLFSNPTAFDYGYVDFVYDTSQLTFDQPISLSELAHNEAYTGKIILEQPGLSSPGTQLLLWGQAVFGDNANEFWQALEQQTLTVAPDWSTAYYSMFLNGEAPIVLSYVTSPAYHIDQEGSDRYAAIPISDGYLKQTEYVALVDGSTNATTGQAFIDYILSDSVQNLIPTTQWMYPVAGDPTTRPAAFEQIIIPTQNQTLELADETIRTNFTAWLDQWNSIFGL